jgi:DNA-binding NtrC family response regulator
MKPGPMRILLIEDNLADTRYLTELLLEDNHKADLTVRERLSDSMGFLADNACDIVLLDLNLPDSNGMETFDRLHQQYPGIPTIILTGVGDRELAVSAIKKGAQDFLVKGQFDHQLLVRVMHYSTERQKLLNKLEQKIEEINTLKGLLPICSYCKKIRDDKGYWESLEVYIGDRSGAEFSHGICPDCAKKQYGQILDFIAKNEKDGTRKEKQTDED